MYRFLAAAFMVISISVVILGCNNPTVPDSPGPDVEDLDDDPGPDPIPDPTPDPDPDPEVIHEVVAIDFVAETSGYVAAGFSGAGLDHPPTDGQLDSVSWRVSGFSDGDHDFGDTNTAGDFARGLSPGAVSTGGLYAFEVEPGNIALGVQPTSSDFQPGSICLRLEAPDGTLDSVDIGYGIWMRNDQDRSTVWMLEWSTDDVVWTADETRITSAAGADGEPAWIEQTAGLLLNTAALASADVIYLRWTAADGDGSGSRDESAIDDIVVTFSYSVP